MKRIGALVVLALSSTTDDAHACTCDFISPTMLSPSAVDDVPLNTKIRFDLRSQTSNVELLFRKSGDATNVAFEKVARVWREEDDGAGLVTFELTPKQPLEPKTRYEVGFVAENFVAGVVKTRIFGAFVTGETTDKTAPVLDGLSAKAHRGGKSMTAACIDGRPWVSFHDIALTDPSRPNAQLSWAFWFADANGKIDEAKPPSHIVRAYGGSSQSLDTSLCDQHWLPWESTTSVVVAAVDEAGNTSAHRKLLLDFTKDEAKP